MALKQNTIIVADDLTGANDTALQYFKNGSKAKIIIDLSQEFYASDDVDVWSISTETRNADKETAVNRVLEVCERLKKELACDNFYKKIDSTLRGNVGLEVIAAVEVLGKDAAIVAPAYIEENRTTIGGFQLLSGMLIERTQAALDPKAPIFESYIPDILKRNFSQNFSDLIGVIGSNIVVKGAALIVSEIKNLIDKGKKIIVVDASINTDLEQIALAIDKCGFNIMPVGSAGLAGAINRIGHKSEIKSLTHIPNIPRLIVSGSATKLTYNQIEKLNQEKPNTLIYDIQINSVLSNTYGEIVDEISKKLSKGSDVVLHASNIDKNSDDVKDLLIDAGVSKDEVASKITDFLSDIVYELNQKSKFILITVGGETSYKCTYKINSKFLEIMDAIMPAIPLCTDVNGKIIVTKSGNFGTSDTLLAIINYFDRLKR